MDDCKQTVKVLGNSLMQHQIYLESMETKKRIVYLIISGIPEEGFAVDGAMSKTNMEKK